jgi:hypothetical protein
MLLLPLHGTLDFHDGLAVLVLALTLALGSLLSSLRRRQRAALTPPPAAGAPPDAAATPEG